MSWSFDSERPIYAQLIDMVKQRIANGSYPPGSRLDSVRDMAAEAGVNPNTMQKALTELERMGLVYAQRTAGRYITDDPNAIRAMRQTLAEEKIAGFCKEMKALGFTGGELAALVARAIEEEKA